MILFLVVNVSAKEYIFKAYGNSKLVTINISDNFKFFSYTYEGM